MYFYALSAIRGRLARIPYFASRSPSPTPPVAPVGLTPTVSPLPTTVGGARPSSSALVKLSSEGNLIAGALGRTSVGFLLNPITVLKVRYEVSSSSPVPYVRSA